jgi:hypothetical protein
MSEKLSRLGRKTWVLIKLAGAVTIFLIASLLMGIYGLFVSIPCAAYITWKIKRDNAVSTTKPPSGNLLKGAAPP